MKDLDMFVIEETKDEQPEEDTRGFMERNWWMVAVLVGMYLLDHLLIEYGIIGGY